MRAPLDHMILRKRSDDGSYSPRVGTRSRWARNKSGRPRPHQGWDLLAHTGTQVWAIADGVVRIHSRDADRPRRPFGNCVLLQFYSPTPPHCFWALYGHLSVIWLDRLGVVKEGTPLGLTGMTGNARHLPPSQAHLHFEILISRPTDSYFAQRIGTLQGTIDPGRVMGYIYPFATEDKEYMPASWVTYANPTPARVHQEIRADHRLRSSA
jgi:murein DD-endopeptidase MepM/ murein hydrolase activator NlpD